MWAVRMNKVGYLAAVCALVATAVLALWLLGSGESDSSGSDTTSRAGAVTNTTGHGAGLGDAADSGAGIGDAADSLIFWAGVRGRGPRSPTPSSTTWKARGVDGFVCMTGRLRGLGGAQDFSGDPDASLAGANYSLQRSLRDSRIVERAKARGMKLYLGVKLANYYNDATPLKDWFDDAGWSREVLPKMRNLAAAAKLYGFAGIALDQELYPSQGGDATATWGWDYPGNTRSEAAVRAKARQRGAELMGAILDGFPGAELAVYHFDFPGDWNDVVQEEVNDVEDVGAGLLHIDFWDGMTSVEGYGAIRFFDSIFYKDPAPRELGERPDLQRQPGPRHLLAPLLELGLRIRARLRLAVQLDRRRAEHGKLIRRRSLARRCDRAAARLSQVGHGRRVRQLRLRAARGLRLLALRARDAGRLEARHRRRGRADARAHRSCGPDDRGHGARQPRDPRRAVAGRSRRVRGRHDELGGPGRRLRLRL